MKRLIWNRHTKSLLRLVAGWFFIVLGIIGCFLPILQGFIFLALGVFLLADHVPFFGRIRSWIHRRFPKMTERVHQMGEKFRKKSQKHNSDID